MTAFSTVSLPPRATAGNRDVAPATAGFRLRGWDVAPFLRALTGPGRILPYRRIPTRGALAIPDTHASLLVRLRNSADDEAWRAFVEAYGPLLYGFGLRRGIPDTEIEDFVQDVMSRLAGAIGDFEYDPSKGTFRSWMFQVARFVLLNRRRAASRRPSLAGGSTLLRAAEQSLRDEAEQQLRDEWEQEYRRQLFARAAERVRDEVDPDAWESFWRTAVGGENGETVAADQGITAGALYVRRSRILKRVRDEVERIRAEWDSWETPT